LAGYDKPLEKRCLVVAAKDMFLEFEISDSFLESAANHQAILYKPGKSKNTISSN
jgi:hypothetical protein